MYKEFYGLKENPFKLSPSVKHFFLSSQFKRVLSVLKYGIEQRVGFMVITGEVGLGKTSFIRYFLSTLGDDVERAYLINPAFTRSEDLFEFLLLDFGIISSPTSNSKAFFLHKLHEFLLQQYEQGKKVLCIVDDAQACPDVILEELRLISNFETNDDKLINILLVGQPELKNKINSPSLRQLKQRIAIMEEIKPLNREETESYINFRIIKAGGNGNFFDSSALKLLYKKTKGIPRLINLVAERSLVAGYVNSKSVIGKKEVKLASKEFNL